MSFLLDTNAVSEWVKPQPNAGLVDWMESADEDRVFISVVSLAELHYGVERLAVGRRRTRLEQWVQHELPLRFESRILPVDIDVAEAWGRMMSPLRGGWTSDGRNGRVHGCHRGKSSVDAGDPQRFPFSAA